MATQGLVTVVSNGKVVMKVIVGCEGYRARSLAQRLRKAWPVTAKKAFEMAKDVGFGCDNCRVVMNAKRSVYAGDPLSSRYRKTFQQPRFNPRWEKGTADHIVVVKV